MSDRMTAAINLLIRLLPLTQLILMRKLYFAQNDAMEPVFWTGLAFWLLFALAPLRRLVRAISLSRRQVSGSTANSCC